MGIQAHAIVEEKWFGASRAALDGLVERLSSKGALAMTHSEVENLVAEEGREVMRLLVQDHLTLRAAREQSECAIAVVGEDDVRRSHRRENTSRALVTQFGEVEVSRTGYSARGADSRFPIDAELNLPTDKYSLPLRRRVAQMAAQVSFDNVVQNIESSTGITVGKRQSEELAARAAQDFEAFYATRAPVVASPAPLLVLSTDGKGIVMRPEDLRAATRRKAATHQNKLHHRLTAGEKSNRKRMAQVAAVWTVEPFVRTAKDVIRELRSDDDGPCPIRPRPESKRVWASLVREPVEVIEQGFLECLSRDVARTKQWLAVVDGNQPQIAMIKAAAIRHGVDVRIIVDLIHVLDYLWDAAWAFHPKASPAAEQWVTDHLAMLLDGKSSDVAAGIRRSATRRNLSAKERAAVDDCADYLLDYREYLHYDVYLERGYPIASGVIEGACRHLIKDRMDLTGARWRLEGAEAVLRLRALRSSGDFDAYWAFHESQELRRNHAARYAAGEIPARPSTRRTRMRLVSTPSPSLSS